MPKNMVLKADFTATIRQNDLIVSLAIFSFISRGLLLVENVAQEGIASPLPRKMHQCFVFDGIFKSNLVKSPKTNRHLNLIPKLLATSILQRNDV